MPMEVEDLAACKEWFTAKERVENEQAWKIDFKSLFDKALADATPHWDAASDATTHAHRIERQIKEKKDKLRASGKDSAQYAQLESDLAELETAVETQWKVATDEQAAGDAIYWPIFNLDLKNPNTAEALEHRPPRELVTNILDKEREILRLIEEIQGEVEALV
jgi:type I restriction enzyme M protein